MEQSDMLAADAAADMQAMLEELEAERLWGEMIS